MITWMLFSPFVLTAYMLYPSTASIFLVYQGQSRLCYSSYMLHVHNPYLQNTFRRESPVPKSEGSPSPRCTGHTRYVPIFLCIFEKTIPKRYSSGTKYYNLILEYSSNGRSVVFSTIFRRHHLQVYTSIIFPSLVAYSISCTVLASSTWWFGIYEESLTVDVTRPTVTAIHCVCARMLLLCFSGNIVFQVERDNLTLRTYYLIPVPGSTFQ